MTPTDKALVGEREQFEKWFDANYHTIDPIARQTVFAAWQASATRFAEIVAAAQNLVNCFSFTATTYQELRLKDESIERLRKAIESAPEGK